MATHILLLVLFLASVYYMGTPSVQTYIYRWIIILKNNN